MLLANDIDNSNPAVQAEQLNWLHYIMNIGSILGNDPSANFDGVRIDAVDNVDADLLQIASDYFKEKYRVADNEANAIAHCQSLKLGHTTTTNTTRIPRVLSCPLTIPYVKCF